MSTSLRRHSLLCVLVAVAVLLLPVSPGMASAQEAAPQQPGVVVRVVDGDTVDVQVAGAAVPARVRIIGLDTPETVDPRQPAQCFGPEASARAKELLPRGKPVTLTADASQGHLDRYGRRLAFVGLSDGRDFGQVMIGEGYAHEYTYRLPYARQAAYRSAAIAARAEGIGLWSPAACSGVATPVDLAPGRVFADFVYGGPYDPAGADRDRADFATWQEAQAFFIAAGGPDTDRHRLDQGGADGIACEGPSPTAAGQAPRR